MEIFKPWLEVSATGIQVIGRSPFGTVSILSSGVAGVFGFYFEGAFTPHPNGSFTSDNPLVLDVGVSRVIAVNITSGTGSISTANVETGSSGGFQTRVETLIYAAEAVAGVSFTHDKTQASSGSGVFVDPISVVKNNIGNGVASVGVYGHASYWGNDSTVNIVLPAGTITTPFIDKKRAFRDELNVEDYVLATTTTDNVAINRDDNITGNSPLYFIVDGLGDW